jgi:hypothetical protein
MTEREGRPGDEGYTGTAQEPVSNGQARDTPARYVTALLNRER